MRSFYQDRLGTNTGRESSTQKQTAFSGGGHLCEATPQFTCTCDGPPVIQVRLRAAQPWLTPDKTISPLRHRAAGAVACLSLRKNGLFFECCPYVCPEPVSLKRSFSFMNGSIRPFFPTVSPGARLFVRLFISVGCGCCSHARMASAVR